LVETGPQAARLSPRKPARAGFTFAEAARSAGVSPAAPYRHFRDRDALMADVARRGFERFGAALAEAWDEGRPEPVKALENTGRAYLAFARSEPAYFTAMFEAQLPPDLDREAVCAILPRQGRPPALMVGLHAWTLAHGIATLFARGDAARRALPMPPEELLEAGLLVYLGGLGLDGD
jgi:AcrR family transcriptional regulator